MNINRYKEEYDDDRIDTFTQNMNFKFIGLRRAQILAKNEGNKAR